MYGKYRSTGTGVALEVDDQKNMYVRSCGGKLSEAALDGRLFSVCNQAAVAVTAALNTTWTGLGISNPLGSGKNAILHQFGWSQTVVSPAEGAFGLMTSDTTGFAAALTIKSCMPGSGTSVLYADDGATIATPILERVVGGSMEGAISTTPSLGPNIYNFDGSLILPPGRSIMTYHTVGMAAAFVFFFLWEEVEA